jgi:hypothetical protein
MNLSIVREGASERAALDQLRAEISATIADIEKTEALPAHADEVRAALLREAQRHVAEGGGGLDFETYVDGRGQPIRPDFKLADYIWLVGADRFADAALQRLEAEGKVGKLRAADRARQLAKLRARLDELEVAEEMEVMKLERDGHTVLRRAEARPELLLAVWGNEGDVKRKEASRR